ncbi:acyl-CoA thioesterase [Microlunatus capsulatus]|uniref:Acyl-CoA thioester hydrolase n=1 Tax=Microlunatus capsulatus TaxID=99117 RepID=A0ABS4ZCA2_9ACTN|nr:thioesterase family protein [Microlunatus capsulatus]MBP2418690.1 acyl-CoA thioester hydrolase [Microlunatus capsulatus]
MTGYPYRQAFGTRWNDNDQYGHVNNVVHYEAMDTTINRWLIERTGLDPRAGTRMAVCAASSCRYRRPVSYPDTLEVGLRAGRVGTTSITWELGLFVAGDPEPAAEGTFTHVFVDPATGRPVPIPDDVRSAVERELR